MQAVILAAGRGTRFGKLTEKTPKSLMLVRDKPILEYTLSSLPSQIDEVIIIIGHLGYQIKNRFGNKFGNKKIRYLDLKNKLFGTAFSVWQAKSILKDKFLVINGDDLYDKKEFTKLIKPDLAVGLAKSTPPSPKYLNIELDKNKNIIGTKYPTGKEMKTGILMATGAYALNKYIFKYRLIKISSGEYGLPQVVFKMARNQPVKGVIMQNWIQINTPEEIKNAIAILDKPRSRR